VAEYWLPKPVMRVQFPHGAFIEPSGFVRRSHGGRGENFVQAKFPHGALKKFINRFSFLIK
jgi:hypothetical protein